jgi:hypothetical protein
LIGFEKALVRILLSLATLLLTLNVFAAQNNYMRQDCPVIGNSASKIYHTPGSDSYRKLLKANERGEDTRVCFRTEREAKDAGYRKARK